jgi:antitoxin HicB
MIAKIPLTLAPQPEGGFTVTSPLLAELVTEGDTFESAIENAKDALAAVVELYEDTGRELPPELFVEVGDSPITMDTVLAVP